MSKLTNDNFCTFILKNGETKVMSKEQYFDFLSNLNNSDLLKLMKGELNNI